MLENLPKMTVEYFLSGDKTSCPECENTLHIMGKKIRQELKLIPAKIEVVEHVTHVYFYTIVKIIA